MNPALTDMQRDALTEIFNIGMGRAAHSLSQMANDEITLNVPSLALATRKDACIVLSKSAGGRVCSVIQQLKGDFTADAILIFPESSSLSIVRLMVGDAYPGNLTEMEEEALTEIGNIILNACFGTLINMLGGDYHISLPSSKIGSCNDILELENKGADEIVMLLYIDFILKNRTIYGHVAILLEGDSMPSFVQKLQEFLASYT
ncbi:MAG TPA: chemotaxis protein CheC [Methylophilaceae bacterium]|nr:chemotaxis protein CheC [Methylophilaceae bacterium]